MFTGTSIQITQDTKNEFYIVICKTHALHEKAAKLF